MWGLWPENSSRIWQVCYHYLHTISPYVQFSATSNTRIQCSCCQPKRSTTNTGVHPSQRAWPVHSTRSTVVRWSLPWSRWQFVQQHPQQQSYIISFLHRHRRQKFKTLLSVIQETSSATFCNPHLAHWQKLPTSHASNKLILIV